MLCRSRCFPLGFVHAFSVIHQIPASQKEQSCTVMCVFVCVSVFRLNQLCHTKAIKAYGSRHCLLKNRVNPCCPHWQTVQGILWAFAQAYQGLVCYYHGNGSKNSLWDPNQSKSSTLDRQPQSSHVSTEPWAPGILDPRINLWVFLNLHKTILHPHPFVRTTGGLVITDYNWHSCRAGFTLSTLSTDKWLNFLSEEESAVGV